MILDNYDLFKQHDTEQERWLNSRPVCECCEEHIQDESYHRVFGNVICDGCLDRMIEYVGE